MKRRYTYAVNFIGYIWRHDNVTNISQALRPTDGTWFFTVTSGLNMTKNISPYCICRPINAKVVAMFERDGGYNPKELLKVCSLT